MQNSYYLAYHLNNGVKEYLWETLNYDYLDCMAAANRTVGDYSGSVTFTVNGFTLEKLSAVPMYNLVKNHLKEISQVKAGKACLSRIAYYMSELIQHEGVK